MPYANGRVLMSPKTNWKKFYQGPSPVQSTSLAVESTTPLMVEQLVQEQRLQRGSFGRAAWFKELLPDGKVKLTFLTWGTENKRDNVIAARRSIQLAPPELVQPNIDQPKVQMPATATPTSPTTTTGEGVRTRSEATGRFKSRPSLPS